MAQRRGGDTGVWQIWLAAAALALGCGMVIGRLLPAGPQRWVANLTASVTRPRAPEHPIRDPLAIGPEAIVPDAIVPAAALPRAAAADPAPMLVPSPAVAEAAPPRRPLPAPRLAAVVPVPPPRLAAIMPAPAARPYVAPPSSAPDRDSAWRRNAVPAGPDDGRPMIAIVIDDMGLDRRRSDAAAALPAPLTLSFMTYAEDLPGQVAAARARGHEIMMHVPMEPLAAHVDPGPNALTYGLDQEEIRRRMTWDLARIDGIVGINNHMGSRFTEWSQGMMPVLAMLRERGLFFLDSRTTARSVGIDIASEIGLPHAARDVFLDNDLTDPAVAGELAQTEAVARRNGAAIAIGHPHDPTLAQLRRWLPLVEAHGFRLVPVSAIVRRNEAASGHEPRSTAQD
jgi:polysaccharide deacetylase 2 family uncharacterized protein YibQ